MKSLKKVLMDRDEISDEKASEIISDAKNELYELLESEGYVDEEEFMSDWFGLEPDYIMDLI